MGNKCGKVSMTCLIKEITVVMDFLCVRVSLRGTVCHSEVSPNEEITGYVQKAKHNEHITDPVPPQMETPTSNIAGELYTNGPVWWLTNTVSLLPWACVEWMIKEENKIHVARHIDLLQESSNIVLNRAEWTTSAPCASVSVSRCGSAAVHLTPRLRAGTCRHWIWGKRTDLGAQNRASVPAACSDRRNSFLQL